jgi:hypothetical protein
MQNAGLIQKYYFAAVIAASIIASVFFSITLNYGGDVDTYGILRSFLNVLHNGHYAPSRFTGYPVAEVSIGYLAWIGGSSLSNLVTYILYLLSVLIFPFCFVSRIKLNRYLGFVALGLSSPLLVFDNIQSMDYSWALFFWVCGCFCIYRLGSQLFAVIPFALSIGCRPSFAIFVAASALLLATTGQDSDARSDHKSPIRRGLSLAFASIFAGSIFYIPIWFNSRFGLTWLTAGVGEMGGFVGHLARLTYKTSLAIGLIQLVVLFAFGFWLLFFKRLKFMESLLLPSSSAQTIVVICILNLLMFFKVPHELSYLQPLLLCLYMTLVSSSVTALMPLVSVLVALNIFGWIVEPRLLKVNQRSVEGICPGGVAESVSLGFHFEKGRVESFLEASKNSICYNNLVIGEIDYSKSLRDGLPLRLAIDAGVHRIKN